MSLGRFESPANLEQRRPLVMLALLHRLSRKGVVLISVQLSTQQRRRQQAD